MGGHLFRHWRAAVPDGEALRCSKMASFHHLGSSVSDEISMSGHSKMPQHGLVSMGALAASGSDRELLSGAVVIYLAPTKRRGLSKARGVKLMVLDSFLVTAS